MTSSTDTEALARRLVACPHFRWLPGMRTRRGDTVVALASAVGEPTVFVSGTWPVMGLPEICARPRTEEMPDLDDPATLGCIEHGLLPEAWSADVVVICDGPRSSPWRCAYRDANGLLQSIGARVWWTTKAEALVAALEAAPAR